MLEKLEVILSANKLLNPLGYAVVDAESVMIKNLVDVPATSEELYYGQVRLQGIDGKSGDIELRIGSAQGFETSLKETVSEGQSKSFDVVFFNKVQTAIDLQAYFTGFVLKTVNIQTN